MSILVRISDEHEKLLVENGERVYMINKASQNVFVGTVEDLKTVSDSYLATYDFVSKLNFC